MSTVIEELVVELNARTERLEQGLAKARAEIGKTVPATTAAGAAGSKMGQQFADAAEKMGQLGSKAGATTSQLLEQGSTLSSMFGAGSGVVGGLSIATLAILGIGAAATKMAEEVDASLRKVEARVPQVAGRMGELCEIIRDMSLAGPHSQAELATAAAEIGRQGAGSLEEVQSRLAAVTKLADATGENLTDIIAGLDQATDLFGLSADEAEGFVAKLFATAQNRMPIKDLFDTLQAAAPAVRDFGIDADIATRAIAAMIDGGLNARQASARMKEYASLGKEGAAEIRKLADAYVVAGDASAKLDAAQAKMNAGSENTARIIRNNLSAALIDLGNKILPGVTAELRGLVGLLDLISGTVSRIKGSAGIGTLIAGFSESGTGVSAQEVRQQMAHLDELARKKSLDLGGLSVAHLDRMLQNITAVATATKTSEAYFASLKRAIGAAREEAEKLEETQGRSKPTAGAGAGAGTGGRGVRTPEQIRADKAAAEKEQQRWEETLEKGARAAIKAGEDFERSVTEAGEQFWKEYGARLSAAMDNVVDTTDKTFKRLRLLASQGLLVLPDDFAEQEAKAMAAAKVILAAQIALEDLAQAQARGQGPTAANLAALSASAKELEAQRARAKAGTEEWKNLGAELKKVQEAITRILDGVGDASKGIGTSVSKTTDELILQAHVLQQAVDGALQLAQAFGVVDANAASTLRSVTQIASNIPALAQAWAKRSGTGQGEGLGALVGAALPVAGAAASIVSGFLSSAKAAREHARALAESRRKLTESLQDRLNRSGLNDQQQREQDAAKQRRDELNAILDLLVQAPGIRIGTRDEFLAKDEGGQRKVLTDALAREKAKFPAGFESSLMRALEDAIKQFDLVAEAARKAKEDLEAELAAKRKDIDQSLAERRLKLADRNDEADAIAFARAQEQELAEARAGGVYTAEQLAELQAILNDELAKYIADQKRRLDEEAAAKARQVQVDREDLQTRINAADGETPAERERRRGIEKERELLDWMAKGADEATLALVRLAQSADDAAAAARAAMEAQREVQDLDVELLQLQGKTSEAEARAFELELQRRWEDAVAAGKSPEVLAKLAEVIAAKREERAAQQAGGAAAGQSAPETSVDAARGGATSAQGSGVQTATLVQVDRLLGLTGTVVALLQSGNAERIKQTLLMTRGSGWSIQPPAIPPEYRPAAGPSMAGATVIQLGGIRVNVIAPDGADADTFGRTIADRVLLEVGRGMDRLTLHAIDVGLANNGILAGVGRGEVSR